MHAKMSDRKHSRRTVTAAVSGSTLAMLALAEANMILAASEPNRYAPLDSILPDCFGMRAALAESLRSFLEA